jgi:hypothetical protein
MTKATTAKKMKKDEFLLPGVAKELKAGRGLSAGLPEEVAKYVQEYERAYAKEEKLKKGCYITEEDAQKIRGCIRIIGEVRAAIIRNEGKDRFLSDAAEETIDRCTREQLANIARVTIPKIGNIGEIGPRHEREGYAKKLGERIAQVLKAADKDYGARVNWARMYDVEGAGLIYTVDYIAGRSATWLSRDKEEVSEQVAEILREEFGVKK